MNSNAIAALGEQAPSQGIHSPPEPGTKRKHLDNLDVVRGLAILGVLLFHSVDSIWRYNDYYWNGNVAKITFDFNSGTSFWLYPSVLGWLGVAVFFALSGFCIHYSQGRNERPRMWLDFFLKRGFRIIPAYWLVLLGLAAQRVNWHASESIRGFFMHFFLVQNLSSQEIYHLNPSFWSIAVEAQLYLLYPIIWYAARKIGWGRIVVITLLIELLLRSGNIVPIHVFGVPWPSFIGASPFVFWFSWTVGAYAAELHRWGEKFAHMVLLGWVGILGGFVAASWKLTSSFSFPLVATGTALLLLAAC